MVHLAELPTIKTIAEGTRIASKPHTCLVCGLTIEAGERYFRFVYRNDSLPPAQRRKSLRSVATHLECPK